MTFTNFPIEQFKNHLNYQIIQNQVQSMGEVEYQLGLCLVVLMTFTN